MEGIRFPTITASSLEGTNVTLPDAVGGKVALIVIAFERAAQSQINSWVGPFEATFENNPGVVVYEVPMIDSAIWRMMRGMIDAGMRAGIPQRRHAFVMTYYESSGPYREALEMDDRSRAYLFLLDREGTIRWSASGYASPEQSRALIETASSLLVPMAASP
ncbi:MAG: hypothetical protein QCH35_01595 [Methanomicrobiaceae archaeon]|nr:hypothetical protein [Methanomicrobiaceae archaeon]